MPPRLQSAILVAGKVVAYLVLTVLLLLLFGTLVNRIPLGPHGAGFRFAVAGSLGSLVAAWICMRFFEKGSLLDIGLRWSGRNFLWGAVAGISSALLVTVIPALTGMAEFREVPRTPPAFGTVALMAVLFFIAAAHEEIQLRGYLLQVLMRAIGLVPSAVLTGMLFAAGHLMNPNRSNLGMLNTFLAGVVLAVAFRASGDLWFPIGIHYAWNLLLVAAGADLSGFTMRLTKYELVWKVGPLWSGGAYGPEGGLLTTIAFSAWLLWAWKAPLERRLPWMLTRPDPLSPVRPPEPSPLDPPTAPAH